MTVQEVKNAIRIAESIGDKVTAEQLKLRLQQMTIND